LFCRDNANCHALFQRRHELWESQRRKLGIHLDQPSLNRALWETPGGLTQMPPEFNSPVDVGPAFEAGAWVYHYYISVYAGKPRNDSVLGIVSQEIRRRGRIHPSLLRALSASKRAFYAEAHDIRHALKQRWWRRAGNLWFDTLREIPTRKSAWRSLLLLGPRAGCVSGNTAAFWQQALVGNTETGPRKTGTR
jgi:hypothetical protein